MDARPLSASFRDPSGFLFSRDGVLYRQVNKAYRKNYDCATDSGLFEELAELGMLIRHTEVDSPSPQDENAYKVLRPELVPFISYPYEWSFSQLKDAALLTLDIQARALGRGMILKDASAYNVQFKSGKPVFIDTLSFEIYCQGKPWVAYRQFCQHFLAPLALMAHVDERLLCLLRTCLDGVPLDLASKLLPRRTRWSIGLGLHLHLHARSQQKHANRKADLRGKSCSVSLHALRGLLDGLRTSVEKLSWKPGGSEWFDYYESNNNYTERGLQEKERIVAEMVAAVKPGTVWDLGGNVGRFSRIAASGGARVVCWDMDPGCVEANYCSVKQNRETGVLPLWLDLTNPSSGIGWAGRERMGLTERGPADMVLSLGLIHHLAISGNVPLARVARFFSELATALVVEFVPKEDGQVQKLLSSREDVFPGYHQKGFEEAFESCFKIDQSIPIPETKRILYSMTRAGPA